MPSLKNNRHERFALAILKGMNQTQAAIDAGYKKSRARFTGRDLATYGHIIDRIRELQGEVKSDAIMTVQERQGRLSEIARANLVDFVDKDGDITLEAPNSGALQELAVHKWHGGKEGRASSESKKVKLHSPMTAIDLLNKMGGDYPPSKVELEPGKELGEVLSALLSRLRGYGNKERTSS